MIKKLKLFLALALAIVRQIGMRGPLDTLRMVWHVSFIVFGINIDKHYQAKHRLNMKFVSRNISLNADDAPCPSPVAPDGYRIWVLWWQGEEQMPKIVKTAYNSIRRATDKKVVLITKDNVGGYIDIPEYIAEKVKRGQLSLAALSDYIRVSLLYRYGGLWVDSTILCVGKLPEDVFNKELFTIKNKPAGQKFVAGGKWNVQFLGTNQIHSKVFFLMKSIFDQYWEKYSVIIDYLLVDYSFQYIYDTHPDCRAAFDAVPMTNAHMHELLPVMNSAFSADEWQRLQSDDTFLFKLTYKWQYEETCRGKDTFYSYVIKQFG